MEKRKSGNLYIPMLLLIVLIWGISPIIGKWLLGYYSPVIKTAASSVVAFAAMLVICAVTGKLKNLNGKYFAVALPTGIFYSSACILQSIGLESTTPAMLSFLENLSCITVPALVWMMTKRRPSVFKFAGAFICLASVYILGCSDGFASFKFGTGELLCAVAGLFYGVNIAVTGIKARELEAPLYLLVQFGVNVIFSSVFACFWGTPVFTFSPLPLVLLVGVVLVSTVFGWIVRTICLKHLDPTLVTVIMPFSSVVTTVISIFAGMDKISPQLIVGAALGVCAVIVCDIKKQAKNEKNEEKRTKKENVSGIEPLSEVHK